MIYLISTYEADDFISNVEILLERGFVWCSKCNRRFTSMGQLHAYYGTYVRFFEIEGYAIYINADDVCAKNIFGYTHYWQSNRREWFDTYRITSATNFISLLKNNKVNWQRRYVIRNKQSIHQC